MAVQERLDNQIDNFELAGDTRRIDGAIVAQDAGRGIVNMLDKTLMVLDPATDKWAPFTDETVVTGLELPRGILKGTIPYAAIVAGDVPDVIITVGQLSFNENQLVIENSKTLETVITSATCSVRSWLRNFSLFAEAAEYVDRGENS